MWREIQRGHWPQGSHPEITMINILWSLPSYSLSVWHTMRGKGSRADSSLLFPCYQVHICGTHLTLHFSQEVYVQPQGGTVIGHHHLHLSFREVTTRQANDVPPWKDCRRGLCLASVVTLFLAGILQSEDEVRAELPGALQLWAEASLSEKKANAVWRDGETDLGTSLPLLDPAVPAVTAQLHEPIRSFLCLK